ncbi:MAG: hypothetical protein MR013_07305, partial [Prevotella sp.]|nr:hypothetical protein [Prevotella sp.]
LIFISPALTFFVEWGLRQGFISLTAYITQILLAWLTARMILTQFLILIHAPFRAPFLCFK